MEVEVKEMTGEVPVIDMDKVLGNLKEKYPGVRLFRASAPYVGDFIFRQQTMADVKASTEAVDEFVDNQITAMGGHDAVDKLPLEERSRLARETDIEASDISNLMALKRCVLYPESFADDIDNGTVVSGVIPMLIEKVMEISGWTDVEITEV